MPCPSIIHSGSLLFRMPPLRDFSSDDADVVYESCRCRVLRYLRQPRHLSARLSSRQPDHQSRRRLTLFQRRLTYLDASAKNCDYVDDADNAAFAPMQPSLPLQPS